MHPPQARHLGLVACRCCGLVCQPAPGARCPRCQTPLRIRQPHSRSTASALLISAMIFYIPANVLPVMHTTLFGNGSDSTIIAGVIDFWRSGSWGIALLIFSASVLIPGFKFLTLGLLLIGSGSQSRWRRGERTRLYRFTEFIGYWSMLDVVVVAAVSALVKFQLLSQVEPRSGILFFALVVILTMLSAMSFDPRLIWDGEEK
ncbi:paraquat-inducible protein A [Pantoea sp. B65]|uniref:paraquat-inducible protein A n=1 Tax=Pantoea sp. B65 TaxID=2813359 RepID=UPI0039B69312